MRDASLSRVLLGFPIILGGCVLVGLAVVTPDQARLPRAEARSSERFAGRMVNTGTLESRYRARVRWLQRRIPKDHVLVTFPPFVVVSDEAPRVARDRVAENLVWAAAHLKRLYFKRDPDRPIQVWLLSSPERYRRAVRRLFGREPSTPYGFYDAEHSMMVMNIQTGGGTLVHELVHVFMEANFPLCPAWFNEGLGSLYEMVGDRKGRIWGYVNWRLPHLKKAIEHGDTIPLAQLMGYSSKQFYSGDTGLHYAQARFLLYYLQVRGLLVRYYHAFLRNHRSDPSGVHTLKKVLGEADLTAFQKRWEAYVIGLRLGVEVRVTMGDAEVRTLDPGRER